MAAIVRRLSPIFAICIVGVLAGDRTDVLDLFASMTSALSNDNAAGFMNGVDKIMPQYEKLNGYISGLIDRGEITTNIELLKDEGDAAKRSVDLDWTMQVRRRGEAATLVEHEQTIHVELVKQKKQWRVVAISPIDFFDPTKFVSTK